MVKFICTLFLLLSSHVTLAKSSDEISIDIPSTESLPLVVFATELGQIVVEVNILQAPNTSAYFLSLIRDKKFDGHSFFRAGILKGATQPQILEGGLLDQAILNSQITSIQATGLPLLSDYETTAQSGLKHLYGTVTLGRDIFASGDAIPEVVICLQAIPSFNHNATQQPDNRGFPAFGRVIKGMDIVKKIAAQPRAGSSHITFLQGQILTQPIKINQAYQVNKTKG